MFSNLCNIQTLHSAWRQVKSKNSAGGIDGFSVLQFEENLGENIKKLLHELQNKTWNPEPYLRVEVPKKETEKRQLGLLSVKDKIVQQAVKTLIEPRFEKLFLNNSYGYRPDRGAVRAIRRTMSEISNKKCQWVAKFDIDNYFDTINHEILFSRLKSVINDTEMLRLIELSLKMGVVSKRMKWAEITAGVPQGAVLSPLLANFYLHSFDQHITSRSKNYVRYADDFLIFAETKQQIEDNVKTASIFLETRLKLKLNSPVVIETINGVPFLGVVVGKSGISISEEKRQKLNAKIASISLKNGKISPDGLKMLSGIEQYYAKILPQELLLPLDEMLKNKIKVLIENHIAEIPSQKALLNTLQAIPFFSKLYDLDKKAILSECLSHFAETKKAKSATQSAIDKNRKLINQKKLEYQRREGEGAELVVQSFGAYIGKNQKGITVKMQGKQLKTASTQMLKHITVVSRGVSISSDAVYYCMENKIPIDFFDHRGKHYASVISPVSIEQSLWRKQAEMSEEKRAALAAMLIFGKIKNQFHLIKYFHKYHKAENAQLNKIYLNSEQKMRLFVEKCKNYKLQQNKNYTEEIRSFEAQAAIVYWEYVRQLLADDEIGFEKREQHGATDLFNSMLNWGYSLLYPRVWQAVLGAKLNPSAGVLHAYQQGKPTFIYDIIELFRPQAVDRVVISLVQKKEPLEMDNDYLKEDTRNLVTQNILERFNRYEKYRKADTQFFNIIRGQVHDIAAFVAGETEKFKPYIAKW